MKTAAFKPRNGAKAYGIGYEEEISPVLIADPNGGAVAVVIDMTHANDVVRCYEDGTVPTLQNRMGTGGESSAVDM